MEAVLSRRRAVESVRISAISRKSHDEEMNFRENEDSTWYGNGSIVYNELYCREYVRVM